MTQQSKAKEKYVVNTFDEFANLADYSLLEHLNSDPDAKPNGEDYNPREVFSGHYVPVKPSPLLQPEYVCHSKIFFEELGLNNSLVHDKNFQQIFSGDLSEVSPPMRKTGWATGYALSIYGTEYTQQCPFGTGNGYGDGRAISVYEGVINGQRLEMQLKGAGKTPYCRGADGRAVLRSSIREFLVQDHMYALGIPTSRSLVLYRSKSETVVRPWYSEATSSFEPDILEDNPTAISTRVASSFLRVGQLELFARRARENANTIAFNELEMLVQHLIEREYRGDIAETLSFTDQLIQLAIRYRQRLASLVANWIRVGYCEGNFNSDNCAAGGFTLDYGPFGFCELFDPGFQPWTGGGEHFSFFNQPAAAQVNYYMFCKSIRVLLEHDTSALEQLNHVQSSFSDTMEVEIKKMWSHKLGLDKYDEALCIRLVNLMRQTGVDYTIFFRELSKVPEDISALEKSFYIKATKTVRDEWQGWLESWHALLIDAGDTSEVSMNMKKVNPKYTWREWLVVPAYQQAVVGNYALVNELQEVLSSPYDEQSKEVEDKYYALKPMKYFNIGGISQYSCSS